MTRNAFIASAYARRVHRILLLACVCVCAMLPGVALPQSLPALLRLPVERLLQLEFTSGSAFRRPDIAVTATHHGGRDAR